MAEEYLGEIRLFAGDYAPYGWAICNGQALPIPQHEPLFTLIGTTYGGDGQQTFNLPDLRGRVPVHQGQGPGIGQKYALGQKAGMEFVPLNPQELAVHQHAFQASKGPATSPNPQGNVIGSPPALTLFKGRERPESKMPPSMVKTAGGGQPHANRMPYVTITYIISLQGVFPPRG
jgi:microcystin-dependent protein